MPTIAASILFDDLQRAVIALSKRDPVTRIGKRAHQLHGFSYTLADPRLGALRLLVIAVPRHDCHPGSETGISSTTRAVASSQ